MLKSTLAIAAVAAVGAGLAFGLYAWESALPPMTASDRPSFDAATIEHGRIQAAAGYCAECHTAKGGAPFAGNFPIASPFGTIYGSNITPDPETGIGLWSPEAFRRALHDGVDRGGNHLYPAFPFDHFTKMSDADVDAIYAYLMSEVAPVRQETLPSTIPFPLNIRFLQAGWGLLFVDYGRYQPDPAKSDEWNRGAYLVEGVTHCGACHTPRNALGAEKKGQAFTGADLDNWTAPALAGHSPSRVPWTAEDFAQYLVTGSDDYHGVAVGPMAPVVHAGIRELPESDVRAIGTYLADSGHGADEGAAVAPASLPAVEASIRAGRPDARYRRDTGQQLYASACASCHYSSSGDNLRADRPDLGINTSLWLDDPANLLRVILDGVKSSEGTHGVVMPAYREALDDAQIAAIAGYLRASRTNLAPWTDLEARVKTLRAYVGTH